MLEWIEPFPLFELPRPLRAPHARTATPPSPGTRANRSVSPFDIMFRKAADLFWGAEHTESAEVPTYTFPESVG
jgi:hypothetical protein